MERQFEFLIESKAGQKKRISCGERREYVSRIR